MLKAMRSASQSRAAKLLFGLLLISFAVWGIGPVFRGSRVHTAATAGSVKITTAEVEAAYRQQVQSLEQQYGMTLTPQMLSQLGLKRQVAQQMVMQSIYDQEAAKLGLHLGLDLVKQTIASQPVLRDKQGKFQPELFQQFLRQIGMNENTYIKTLRGDLIRTLLMGSVRAGASAPDELTRRLYAYDNEKRAVEATLIKAADMKDVPAPSEDDLTKFHKDHENDYLAPEFRALSYITTDMDKLAAGITVSDDDLRKTYDESPDDYAEPEKRDIVQITTKDQALAQKIAEESGTKSLEEVAKAHDVMAHPLANLTKGGIPPELADIIFKLEVNAPSPAVQSPMGWHVMVVTKITPPHTRSFDEAKDDIAKQVKNQRAQEAAETLISKLGDALAGGAKLEEAAPQFNLTVSKIDNISAFGLGVDDKEATGQPPVLEDILKVAFAIQSGETSQVQQSEKGLFAVRVDGVTPSHVKPLAEVKEQVKTAWLTAKRGELADAKATKLADDLRKGDSLTEMAKLPLLSRDGHDHDKLPESAIPAIFGAKMGDVMTSKTPEGTWLIRVADIKPASLDKVDLTEQRANLKEQMSTDLLEQYGLALRTSYGVHLDETWLEQSTAAE